MPRIHWVARGTATPKDRDEVNRREVCECDGWVCDLDVMGDPSKLNVQLQIQREPDRPFLWDVRRTWSGGSGTGHGWFAEAELLKFRKTINHDNVLCVYCVVYYETIKRELKIKPISECRCDERLKTKAEESTCLSDTGFIIKSIKRAEDKTYIWLSVRWKTRT